MLVTTENIILCTLAVISTALICIISPFIGKKAGLLDRPDTERKIHVVATPLTGGIAIFLPLLTMSFLYAFTIQFEPFLFVITLVCALLLMVGVLDDRFSVAITFRFLVSSAIILLAFFLEPLFVLHTLRLSFIDIPFGVFAWPITLFIVVGFVNAVNMADGINGQFLGMILIWSVFILFYVEPKFQIIFVTLALCAGIVLIFNLRGTLFSGSGGSYAGALFIGLSVVYLYRHGQGSFRAEIPVFWFWLPVTDCLRLVASRIGHGRAPFSADRNHFHHTLLRLMGPHTGLAAFLILAALPGVAELVDPSIALETLLICLLIYFVVLAYAYKYAKTTKQLSENESSLVQLPDGR